MITVQVNAKVNLSLNILGKNNGYHDLDMIVASAKLSDALSVCKAEGVSVNFVGKKPDCAVTNAYKAAEYMCRKYCLPGVKAEICANIPFGCGLGSSSADCAGMINAINELYSLDLTLSERRDVAKLFGSDTAYMLEGGYARLRGRGDIIENIDSSLNIPVLIAYKGAVETKASFAEFDKMGYGGMAADNDALLCALEKSDYNKVVENLGNALTMSSMKLNPHIGGIIEKSGGSSAVMTGSGAAVVIFGYERDLIEKLSKSGVETIETELVPFYKH